MIITKLKDRKELLQLLKKSRSIFIIGCGNCAKQCQTGGEEDVAAIKKFLIESGKKVTGFVVPDETCHIPLVKRELRKCSKEFKEADSVLVMACGAGTAAVREATDKRIYSANDTLSLGNTIRQGSFIGKCSLCGECVINQTDGFCPVTICPKGMLNGPCGGMDKGKCEVDTSNDCVWVKIYENLQKDKDLDVMRKLKEPKNHSKNRKSNKIEVD